MGCPRRENPYRTTATRTRCGHPWYPCRPGGSIIAITESGGTWTEETAKSFEEDLEWLNEKVPVLPTIPAAEEQQENCENDTLRNEYFTYQTLVAKTIQIRDAIKVPEAKAALDKSWKSLRSLNTWSAETVQEYDEVRNKASKEGCTVNFGRVFPISTSKGSELPRGTRAENGKDGLCSKQATLRIRRATSQSSRK